MLRADPLLAGNAFTEENRRFLMAAGIGIGLLAVAVGAFPVAASVATVFLFAAPHNLMEVRFFLSRMPVRWGKSTAFFVTAIGGALALTLFFPLLPFLAEKFNWSDSTWVLSNAGWNSALVLWVFLLTRLYLRERLRRWEWHVPVLFALLAVAWFFPQGFSVALVFLHPVFALIFLDVQLGKSRPEWRGTYRRGLVLTAGAFVLLMMATAGLPEIPGRDVLTVRITDHAGAGVIGGISARTLVSAHVFLETLHYGVWLVAMPIIGLGAKPFRLDTIPLVRHSKGFPTFIKLILLCGLLGVVGFWVAFLANYPITRDFYFTVAMFHVLAEAPFFIRLK